MTGLEKKTSFVVSLDKPINAPFPLPLLPLLTSSWVFLVYYICIAVLFNVFLYWDKVRWISMGTYTIDNRHV